MEEEGRSGGKDGIWVRLGFAVLVLNQPDSSEGVDY